MPTLRSHIEKPAAMKKVIKEQTQWIMIAPDKLTENGDADGSLLKMPHPQSGIVNTFLFKEGHVYQIMKCEEADYRSWFIDETVQKDGAMFMVTPIDPLFLALPYLERFASQDKFSTLDNILVDEKHPDALIKLEECLTKKNLLNICNCKGSDDIVAYKCDESKILAWLSLKIQKLADHLSKTHIHVGHSVKVSNFIRVNENRKQQEDDCLRFAWSMVSDYVSASWAEKVKENLKITEEIKPVVKKQKLNDSTASANTPTGKTSGSVEDYRDHSKSKKAAPAVKLTAVQKSLQKVDKKGMKTMSSFFTSKPKK